MPEPKKESEACKELRRVLKEAADGMHEEDDACALIANVTLKFAVDFALQHSDSSLGHKLEALRLELLAASR